MKIIGFIERRQTNAIRRILRHCGPRQGFIRTQASLRALPTAQQPLPITPSEFEWVSDGEFLEAQFRETLSNKERPVIGILIDSIKRNRITAVAKMTEFHCFN